VGWDFNRNLLHSIGISIRCLKCNRDFERVLNNSQAGLTASCAQCSAAAVAVTAAARRSGTDPSTAASIPAQERKLTSKFDFTASGASLPPPPVRPLLPASSRCISAAANAALWTLAAGSTRESRGRAFETVAIVAAGMPSATPATSHRQANQSCHGSHGTAHARPLLRTDNCPQPWKRNHSLTL
jgi:hypothetical protein